MKTLVYLICIIVASFAVLAQPAVAQEANTTLPLIYPAQVLEGDGNQTCPSGAQQMITRNVVKNAIQELLSESIVPLLQATQLPTEPPTTQSTTQPPTTQLPTTQPPTVTGFSCGGSTGWRRIAYLNMADPSQQCPGLTWREITTPHRVCGRSFTVGSCERAAYTTGSAQYNQVCGRITGYQIGSPEAFLGSSLSIDSVYVDGVSITHGSPRQHIWTFAAGVAEQNADSDTMCPCDTGSTNGGRIPSFVHQNYFCETGIVQWPGSSGNGVFHSNGDPLWDGQQCGSTSSCCTFNSPPWFNVRLPSSTTDYIEVRLCSDQGRDNKDTPIQLLELYVK